MACSSPSDLCGVCLSSFRDARVLPCLHSLCKECVDQLAVTATDGEIHCPICRWTFRLPPGGAATLPTDVTVTVIGVEGLPVCASCVDDETRKKPSTWCKKCRLAFCGTHIAAHILSSTNSGEGHLFVPLSLASPDECAGQSLPLDKVALCPQHKTPLTFHCGSCDASICGDCAAIGDHHGHKPIRYIKDMVQDRKRQVGKKMERLENDVVKRVERSLMNVDNVSAELSIRADQVRADIREAENKAVDMVKAHARQMIQEVDDLEQSRHKVLDHQRDELKTLLDATRNASHFSGRVMELETRAETLFSLLEALETRTTSLLSTHINEEPQSHSRLTLEAASDTALAYKTKESIGKIIPYETSAKHSEIEGDTIQNVGRGNEMLVTIRAKDSKGEYLCTGGDAISTRWSGADQALSTVSISDNGDGSYALSCVCSSVGSYQLEVYINGERMANSLLVNCISDFTFDSNERFSAIRVSDDERRAFMERSMVNSHVSILGSTPLTQGKYTWKMKTGSASNRHIIGIAVKTLLSHKNDFDKFAYCWDWAGGIHCRDGVQFCGNGMSFSANDTLQFHLDCDRHILQITNVRTGESSTMANLPDKEYFQYASLIDKGSSVEFVK